MISYNIIYAENCVKLCAVCQQMLTIVGLEKLRDVLRYPKWSLPPQPPRNKIETSSLI